MVAQALGHNQPLFVPIVFHGFCNNVSEKPLLKILDRRETVTKHAVYQVVNSDIITKILNVLIGKS